MFTISFVTLALISLNKQIKEVERLSIVLFGKCADGH